MKHFLNHLFLALIPIIAINLIAAGTIIYLASHEDLTYVNYASALDKEQRLQDLGDQPKLVIIGGSNTRFSFNSKMLQDSLGIATVNMGIHIGLGLDFMFNQVEKYLKQGDILLVSAEYQHYIDESTYYGDEGLTDMYLVKKEWRKAFRHIIDTHNFLSVYRLIRERIKRNGMKVENISERMEIRTKYNEYGDYTGHYNLPPSDWTNKYFSMDIRTQIPNVIKKRIERIEQKGIRVIILPPPYCRSSFKLNSVTIDLLTHKLSALGIGFTCPPNKMCYSDSIFYDSPYHLLEKGTILHTKNVIKQIKTAL